MPIPVALTAISLTLTLTLTPLTLAQSLPPPDLQFHSDTMLPSGLGASNLALNPTISVAPTLTLYAPGVSNPNWRTFSVPLLMTQQEPPTLSLSTDLSWQASRVALINLQGHLPTRAAPLTVTGQLAPNGQAGSLSQRLSLCVGTPLRLGHRSFELSLCAAPGLGAVELSGPFGHPTTR